MHIWATADGIPVAGDSEDFVVSSHVVEHLPNMVKAFLEWNRIVRIGGLISGSRASITDGYVHDEPNVHCADHRCGTG